MALADRLVELWPAAAHAIQRIDPSVADDLAQLAAAPEVVLLDFSTAAPEKREALLNFAQPPREFSCIALLQDVTMLEALHPRLRQVDDYLLLEHLAPNELGLRVSDTLQRYRREAALVSDQNLLRALLENIPDNIYFKDLQSRFIKVNQSMVDTYGVGSSSLIGQSDFDLFTEEHARPAYEDEQEIIRSGKPIIGKLEKETFANGHVNWMSTTKTPLKNAQGHIIGTMGISRNVSELKQTEAKLKATIETLEETRLQLIEAEKLKTIGRMAAGVAHEVKNPLSIITLGVDVLRPQIKDNVTLCEVLDDMKTAAEKANNVIFELLDYSSPHALLMKPAQVNEIVQRVLSLLRHNLKEAQIRCVEQLDPQLPEVRLDPQKIEQVLINLLLNAINAMPRGGEIEIRSSVQHMQSTGSNVASELTEHFCIGDRIVQLEILDAGHGMQQKDQDKVFDPFYTTNATGSGTGLGLSVTRNIIDLHNGLITLKNRKDHPGCCATLSFHPA